MAALYRAGSIGLSADDAGRRAGVEKHSARSRISELHAHNPPLVEQTDNRSTNESGVQAVVWRLTFAGRQHAEQQGLAGG